MADGSKNKSLFLIAMIAASLVLVGVFMLDRKSDAVLVYVFEDSRGIEAGADVRHQGLQIGEVLSVEESSGRHSVSVEIRSSHKSRIYNHSANTARIKKDVGSEDVWVEILTRESEDGTGVASLNQPITGLESWTDEQLWEKADQFESSAKTLFENSGDKFNNLEKWATEGKGDSLRQDMMDFLNQVEQITDQQSAKARGKIDDVVNQGKSLYERFDSEHGQQIKQDFGQTLDLLKQQTEGITDAAGEGYKDLTEPTFKENE